VSAHVSCRTVSTTGPRACIHHARTTDPHVPVKPRESAPIPNVISSPGIHDPAPLLPRKWSHLRGNSLELSYSLRSKRLTECYYASLTLVFKLVGLTQVSRYDTKPPVAQYFTMLQYPPTTVPGIRMYSNFQLQYPAHCLLQYTRPILRFLPTGPTFWLLQYQHKRHNIQ
jgi:hypothetical protein